MLPNNRVASLAPLLLMVAGLSSPVKADLVTSLSPIVQQQRDGSYLYAYTLMNAADSDLPAINLNIATAADAGLKSFTAPTGWDMSYSPGDNAVSWAPSDIQFAILPSSTGEFGFVSALPPIQGDYSIVGFDPDTFSFGSSTGSIAAPLDASVPEPSSITLLAAAFLGLLFLRQRGCLA
jgi:hypothetical protein